MALPALLPPRQTPPMPRTARIAPGDWVFHALNRANGRGLLFDSPASYVDFFRIVEEAAQAGSMRILAYCAMPDRWHMLLWPRLDGDLARFVQRVAVRHTQRWHTRHQTTGRGHLYQARYRSFAVNSDRHLLTVCRYIERNPLRAGLVSRAGLWPWSSAETHAAGDRSGRAHRGGSGSRGGDVSLTPLPVELPGEWASLLHEPQNEVELDAMRLSVRRGVPYGDAHWQAIAAARLGLQLEYARSGRPPKASRRDGTRRRD